MKKPVYRIVYDEEFDLYIVEIQRIVTHFFFFKEEELWDGLDSFHSMEEAKQNIDHRLRKASGPRVVYRSDTDEELDKAIFEDK